MTFAQAMRLWWSGRAQDVSGEFDAGTLIRPSNWIKNYLGGEPTAAGVRMNERGAEGLPAIYACVHVISETVGQLPLKLYRLNRDGRGKSPDTDHPLYWILHNQSNDELTAYQYREMTTRHLAVWGRAYSFIQRNGRGEVMGLWPLHPARMITDRDGLGRKVFKYWMGRNSYQEWPHDPDRPSVLHLHVNCDDGLDGRSPLLINRESLGITKAAEDFVGAWFGNGATPGVVLTHPKTLSAKARENIRTGWLERFMGARQANKLALLEEGVAVNVVGVDPEKSQLAALRSAQVEAAARIYRVPSFMIQNHTKDTSWGSGIEQQMLGFINLTMMPWFQQWQQVIQRDLLTRQSINTHEPLFIVNSLVRGDLKARVEAYASARQNGWLNGDEIRELEDLNPIDGGAGKVFWQPSNMQPVGVGLPVAVEPDPEPDPDPDPSNRVM